MANYNTIRSLLNIVCTIPTARPNPLAVFTREANERTVTVSWSPVFDGGRAITRYSLEIKDALRKQKRTVVTARAETAGG